MTINERMYLANKKTPLKKTNDLYNTQHAARAGCARLTVIIGL